MKLNKYIAITASAAIMLSCMTACSSNRGGGGDATTASSAETTTASVSEAQTETTTAASTAASTEATTESSAVNSSAAVMPDDIYSFMIDIDGEVYAFPMTLSDFTAHGWTSEIDMTEELRPNSYSVANTFSKGDLKVYVSFINFGKNVEPISNCLIGGISVEDYYVSRTASKIKLPKGIEMNVSTLADVISAYGEPSDKYEGDIYTKLTYEYDSYRDIEIEVNVETDTVSKIEVRNFVETETAATDADSVSVSDVEMPEFVKSYTAPTELGTDFLSFTAEFDGSLYKLPAPVSEFIANGWKIKTDSSETSVSAKSSGRISLMKDNKSFDAYVRNYSNNEMPAEYCFVTDIEAGIYSTDVSMKIQNNIEVGMSEADMLKALGDTKYELNSSLSFNTYKIVSPEEHYDYVVIEVSEGVVTGIQLKYEPSYREFGD